MAAPETSNLIDDLTPELELSVIIYKISDKMRVEILNEKFINYLMTVQNDLDHHVFDDNGMCEINLDAFKSLYKHLRSEYIKYRACGNV
jgi:hypothetical protein